MYYLFHFLRSVKIIDSHAQDIGVGVSSYFSGNGSSFSS